MATNEVIDLSGDPPTQVPEAPKGMYPTSPEESADMIAERREGIRQAELRTAEDQAAINRLQNEISVLNSLRQANGQGPL